MDLISQIKARKIVIVWALAALLFILLAVFVNVIAGLLITLFMALLILDIDSGIPLAISLTLLLACPLLVAIEQDSSAKALAEWAFYFLAIGVVLNLYDYIRSGAPDAED